MDIIDQAKLLADELAQRNKKIVFAESCTAGLVSATLASVPGISQHHCGSAVTYRNHTKNKWLGVSAEDIEKYSAVSEVVAVQMAVGVLEKTPEANIAASITGYLGPNEPEEIDGVIYIAVACKENESPKPIDVSRFVLKSATRVERQREAVQHVFNCVLKRMQNIEL